MELKMFWIAIGMMPGRSRFPIMVKVFPTSENKIIHMLHHLNLIFLKS